MSERNTPTPEQGGNDDTVLRQDMVAEVKARLAEDDAAAARARAAEQPTQAMPKVPAAPPVPAATPPVVKPATVKPATAMPAATPAAATPPARPPVAKPLVAKPAQAPTVKKAPAAPAVPPAAPAAPSSHAAAQAPRAAAAPKPAPQAARPASTRKARLRLVKVDPWSVLKTSFLLSIALGVVMFVAVAVVWTVLGTAGVWDSVNEAVGNIDSNSSFNVNDYVGMGRVLGFTALVAALDVLLLTALATLGAFLYNVAASLLGGIELTFAEERN